MEQIFISYAREDSIHKEKLYSSLLKKLNNKKFNIWEDSQIPPSKFENTIKEEISNSSIYIFLISEDFIKSEFIKKEILWIQQEVKQNDCKIIIPVLIKDLSKNELTNRLPQLANYQLYPKKSENLDLESENENLWIDFIGNISLDITRKKQCKKIRPPVYLIAFFLILTTVLVSTIFIFPQDPCQNIICQNGGECLDGKCECIKGFIGSRCQNEDPCYEIGKWKSNLNIIKRSYSYSLGTNGKLYKNNSKLKLIVSNLNVDTDKELNNMKNNLLRMINEAPIFPDPNYNIEFTDEAQNIRDQLEISIQKYVDKCP